MNYDYETHKGFAKISADCGDIIVNQQDKTVRTLLDRILLCHLRDLKVKKPAQVFPETKSGIVEAPNTAKDATKDIVLNFLTRPPEHNN